ncbi:restriction endonuclease subunit S [Treponema sp. Marseille-Q3903]|nr:restriction endonuclease subunit S [Treponema sp. Marseille-Q3903]
MVADNLALNRFHEEKPIENPLSPTPLQYTSVSLSEVQYNKLRLEASAFNLNAKAAKSKVKHCLYGYVHLWGDGGLVKEAFYGNRKKRNYVDKTVIGSQGFIGSSEMLDINPRPLKFLIKTESSQFSVKEGCILLSRSGTIGNVTFVNKTLSKLLVSEHAIRIEPIAFGGYIYSYLKTTIGKTLIKANTFGAVIDEIEPEHLKNIIIPDAPESIKQNIHELIITSYNLRDQSNDLIENAEKILYQELQLPPIEDLKPTYFDKTVDLRNYTTRLSSLDLRLDCSYHVPICNSIIDTLKKTAKNILLCKDKAISDSIILPMRFKRTYVEGHEYGTKFIGGKHINELNPTSEKYLSTTLHGTRLGRELLLKENTILITRSGTIGKVSIVPKHWENWAANEHMIRVFPANKEIAGYLYCWLSTDYGLQFIQKHTYGAVVDEIDIHHVGDVEIPLLKNELKQQEINNMVLQANDLRYQAYLKEQEAIKMMDDVIEGKIIRF